MYLHRGIERVLFTGSVHAGVAINRALATNPAKIVALEMGGNNPIVVIDTPMLADAAALIVQSAFTTAGQRCTAARRLIVLAHLYEPLMAELLKLTDRLIVDEPFADPPPFMGDRTRVVEGKSLALRLNLGGRRINKKKQ